MDQIKIIDNATERLESGGSDVRITDHAILRYLERIKGLDLKEIRKELLPREVEKKIKMIGNAGIYPVVGSHKLRVRDNVIVTVLNIDMK